MAYHHIKCESQFIDRQDVLQLTKGYIGGGDDGKLQMLAGQNNRTYSV